MSDILRHKNVFSFRRFFHSVEFKNSACCFLQVRDNAVVRGGVSVSGRGGGAAVLGGLHQLDAEPADLRVLQPRLPGGVQEHAAVGLLQPVPAAAVRPGRTGRPPRLPPLRRAHAQRLLRDVPQQDGGARPTPLQRVRQQPLTLKQTNQKPKLSLIQ